MGHSLLVPQSSRKSSLKATTYHNVFWYQDSETDQWSRIESFEKAHVGMRGGAVQYYKSNIFKMVEKNELFNK